MRLRPNRPVPSMAVAASGGLSAAHTAEELRKRRHHAIPVQGKWLNRMVRGYYAYHAGADKLRQSESVPKTRGPYLVAGLTVPEPEGPNLVEEDVSANRRGIGIEPSPRFEDGGRGGCWWRGQSKYCEIQSYDLGMNRWYQSYDSAYKEIFESVGQFHFENFYVAQKVRIASSSTGIGRDTMEGKTGYQRVGGYLYVLNDQYQLAERFVSVTDLDSLPCGTPFALLPQARKLDAFLIE